MDGRGRAVLLRPGETLHGLREDAVVAVNLTAMRRLGEVEHPRGVGDRAARVLTGRRLCH